METYTWKLSPSDFAFLREKCPRCFYLKVVHNFRRPQTPFPGIFSKIDSMMKGYFKDKPTSAIHPSLLGGVVMLSDKWVESEPLSVPGSPSNVVVSGRFDSILQFEDGSYAVIDFKTSETKGENAAKYGRQLHAYAVALEQLAPKKLGLSPISKLGLLSVEPREMVAIEGGFAYNGAAQWLEVPRDNEAFFVFLGEVAKVLDADDLPESGAGCTFCKYHAATVPTRR